MRFLFFLLFCMNLFPVYSLELREQDLSSCKAVLENDVLTLENSFISRKYKWEKGELTSLSIEDKLSKQIWNLQGKQPDLSLPGIGQAIKGTVTSQKKDRTPVSPAFLEVSVITIYQDIQLKREFRIYADCAAIACNLYLKGKPALSWAAKAQNLGDLRNVEGAAAAAEGRAEASTIERLNLPGVHWRSKAVEFFDITDRCNNLVNEVTQLSYRSESRLRGNLLFISEVLSDKGFFVLKEAPPSSVQLAYPGFDFIVKAGDIQLTGIGLQSSDINEFTWTRGYGFVTGVTNKGEYGALQNLRQYQQQIRTHVTNRDNMIMMNTWGDRNQDKSVSESFILKELQAAKRLGITHFQIDDGWQIGRSASSAFGGSLKNIWKDPTYWKVDRKKFPNGLKPVMDLARQLEIEICLWFNPSTDSSYAHWKDDAETLISLYNEFGIRTFKIDGVFVPDKLADVNLRKMFDKVMEATGKQAVFNLDVTSGRRFGYHYFNEYGNVFLENRYTDWGNYYPHWTLRNLWMLSRYVPAQNLQVEFLNKSRNRDKYPVNDELAPSAISFDYQFAITMMAQPLAWMEATGLPDSLFHIAPLVKKYQSIQNDIHAGKIFPIGDEPDGTGWTGFQSDAEGKGYLLVFRENNNLSKAKIKTNFAPDARVKLIKVMGEGKDQTTRVNAEAELELSLQHKNSFVLYQYKLVRP